MELRELKSFLYVVRYENFSKAAEILYISQPTISLHIKHLENELHTKLFKRSTKKIILTTKGQVLYEYANKILSLEKNFVDNWEHKFDNVIKIGTSSIPGAYLLPELIQEFRKTNKNIGFSIFQSDSAKIVEMYKDGLIDIGMIGMDINEKNINCKSFYKDRLVLIKSVEKKQKNDSSNIYDLLSKPFILREDGSGTRKMSENILNEYGFNIDNLNIIARVINQDTLINLVKNGFGVSIVSYKSVIPYIKDKTVSIYEFDKRISERDLYIIYSNKKIEKKYLKDFINFSRKYYQQ